MNRTCLGSIIVVLLVSALPTFAQDDDAPPQIESVTWQIARNTGLDPLFGPFEPYVLFNPSTELAHEGDRVRVTVVVTDDGLPESADGGIFVRKQCRWWPYPPSPLPEPPAVVGSSPQFAAPSYTYIGSDNVIFDILFLIPEWPGANQARLRGDINWDVRWEVSIDVCAEDQPEASTPISSRYYVLYGVELPAFSAGNPPPFADAGADQLVLTGTEVLLDGSRTFDAYNVGFDLNDENIFAKDDLAFTWEWVSGPVRVDPYQTDPSDAVATVTLDVPNDPNDPDDFYQYRLLVDDNVNALPSTDSVRIFVRDSLDTPHPPRAVIEGPANPQPVGAIVTLVSRSTDPDDPDGSGLEYRWQQTDELGGPIDPRDLQDALLPLSGMTEEMLTWQALRIGTFHFRLLVDDGDFRSSARFSVEVIETATSGASAEAGSGLSDENETAAGQDQTESTAPALCGAGVLPLAALPLVLCLMRRRGR